jgi:hypothetical protein
LPSLRSARPGSVLRSSFHVRADAAQQSTEALPAKQAPGIRDFEAIGDLISAEI